MVVNQELVDLLRTDEDVLAWLKQAGQRGDTAVLNGFLDSSETYPRRAWGKMHLLNVEKVRRQNSPAMDVGPRCRSCRGSACDGRLQICETLRKGDLRTLVFGPDEIASSPLVQHGVSAPVQHFKITKSRFSRDCRFSCPRQALELSYEADGSVPSFKIFKYGS